MPGILHIPVNYEPVSLVRIFIDIFCPYTVNMCCPGWSLAGGLALCVGVSWVVGQL